MEQAVLEVWVKHETDSEKIDSKLTLFSKQQQLMVEN